jgi:hypothetical protein
MCSPPTATKRPPKSKIEAMNPEMNTYAARLLVFAHPAMRIANDNIRASSLPLDCVIAVPVRPTRKKKVDRTLDSREYRKAYAEMIAIIGQITVTGATAPPPRRIPIPGITAMTIIGLNKRVIRTRRKSRHNINLK